MADPAREVEYYRLWDDGTWDTDFIDVPPGTPGDQLDEAVRRAAVGIDWGGGPPVIVGLYCANDDGMEGDG